jgi:hypothetical protein
MAWTRFLKQIGRATAASSVAGTDRFMVSQSGVDKYATVAQTRASPTFTGTVVLPTTVQGLAALSNQVNDAGAASASVPVGGLYRNGSVVMVRVA